MFLAACLPFHDSVTNVLAHRSMSLDLRHIQAWVVCCESARVRQRYRETQISSWGQEGVVCGFFVSDVLKHNVSYSSCFFRLIHHWGRQRRARARWLTERGLADTHIFCLVQCPFFFLFFFFATAPGIQGDVCLGGMSSSQCHCGKASQVICDPMAGWLALSLVRVSVFPCPQRTIGTGTKSEAMEWAHPSRSAASPSWAAPLP